MDYNGLYQKVFDIEPTVRFVGIYDCNSKTLIDGFKPGIIPHISKEEHQNSIRYDMRRWETYKMFESPLGNPNYSMVHYDKVNLLTFSMSEGELLRLAIEPDADYKSVIEKIQDLIFKNPIIN